MRWPPTTAARQTTMRAIWMTARLNILMQLHARVLVAPSECGPLAFGVRFSGFDDVLQTLNARGVPVFCFFGDEVHQHQARVVLTFRKPNPKTLVPERI